MHSRLPNVVLLLAFLSSMAIAQPDKLSYERWGKFGVGKLVTTISNTNVIASGRLNYPELSRLPAFEYPYNPDSAGRHIYYGSEVSFHIGGFSRDRGPGWDQNPARHSDPMVESGDQGHYKYYKGFHFDGFPAYNSPSSAGSVALSDDSASWPGGGWPPTYPTTDPILTQFFPTYPTVFSKGLATPIPLLRDSATGFPGAGPNQYSLLGSYYGGQVVADQESFSVSYARNRQDDVSEGHLMVYTTLRGLSWKGDLAEDFLFWIFTVTNVGIQPIDSAYVGLYANFDFPWSTYEAYGSYNRSDAYAYDQYDVDPATNKPAMIGYGWDGDGDVDGAVRGTIAYEKARLTDESPLDRVALAGVVFLQTPRKPATGEELGPTTFDAFAHFENRLVWGIGNTRERFYWYNIVNSDYGGLGNDPDDPDRDRIDNWTWTKPFPVGSEVTYDNGRRCAMAMSTGPFRLQPGETDTLICAVIMGESRKDLFKNAKIARDIFKKGWMVPKPPFDPRVIATGGNGQVTLRWGTISENDSLNQLVGRQKFEGYKIYRSDDGGKTWGKNPITDYNGTVVDYVPLAQNDLVNGTTGVSPILPTFNRGTDSGLDAIRADKDSLRQIYVNEFRKNVTDTLRYTFVDRSVLNGFTYIYAVLAYGAGDNDPSGLEPLQSSKTVGPNVVSVIPRSLLATQSSDVDRIQVVPNPYKVVNPQETSIRDRMVRFIGLPARCEIRIFNIAGELVATLRHDESASISSEEPWNLRSSENREVAPGLYLYHIQSDLGVKTGKLAVIK